MPEMAKTASEIVKDGPDIPKALQIIDFHQKMETQKILYHKC